MSAPRVLSGRARRLLWSGLPSVLALGATGATLRFLVPTRFQAGGSGFWPWLARAAEGQPLLAGVVLFAAFAGVAGYWWRRLGQGDSAPAAELSVGRAATATLVAVVLVLSVRARLVEIAPLTGASMEPTLNPEDRVVVNKLAYGFRLPFSRRVLGAKPPRRGDLVVFRNPDRGPDEPASIVKRVIGLPGDEIAFVNGSPMINGWVVPSCDVGPFLIGDGTRLVHARLTVEILADRAYLTLHAPLDDARFARFKVPAGQVFVLGDDRPLSRDSRAWSGGRGGGLPVEVIEGRVSRLAAAVDAAGRLDLAHPLRGLQPRLRALNVDVTELDERIADCTAHAPRASWPPTPTAPSPVARTR